MSSNKSLIRDRRFWPTFWTQFWGAFNDNVFKNAMVVLITYKSYSIAGIDPKQMVALCGGIFIFPFFLFSAMAGQVCDKYPKDKLMVLIKIWEILVMVLGSVGFITENLPLLLVSLFLMGLQSAFFGPVKYSILPDLIDEDELVEGNALVGMGTFVSILLGTILGVSLVSMGDLGRTLVSIAVLTIAALGCFFSTKIQKLKSCDPSLKISFGLIKPTYQILKLATEVKSVFHSVVGISWFWFLGAGLLSIFPIYVKDVLGADEHVVTLFLGLFSIGVAVGSMICERLSHERLELGLVPFGSIGLTVFIIDLFFVGNPTIAGKTEILSIVDFLKNPISYRILFDLFMLSVMSGLYIVPLYTFVQQRSRPEIRSRIIAANNILNALFMVVASLMLVWFYSIGLEVHQIFLVFAILNAIAAIYVYSIVPEFLLRFLCVLLTRVIYRLRPSGLSNIPAEGPALLVCNHVTYIDWLIIAAAVKRPIRFVMHHSFMKIPVASIFFRGAKVIPIAGKSEDEAVLDEAFDKISSELREGEVICIFPEGLVTYDGKLNKYKPGVERILERDPVPVVPMVLKGLWGSFFSRKYGKVASKPLVIFQTFMSKISLTATAPIEPQDVSAEKLQQLTQEMLDS